MKRLVATLIFAGALAGTAIQAQDQPSAPPPNANAAGHRQVDPDREVKHLTKELKLSADQQTQIKSILEDRQQQMQALRNDTSTAPQDRMSKMRTIREDGNSKITALLNDDQKQKFAAMQQDMRDRMKQRREQRDENPGTDNK